MSNQDQWAKAVDAMMVPLLTSQWSELSPLQATFKRRLQELADQIAVEVLAEQPAVADKMRSGITRVVSQILGDDQYLNQAVVQAVTKALAQYREGGT